MVGEDWNATIWILDELLDDRESFTELDDGIGRTCGREVVLASLKLLARQDLIYVEEGRRAEGSYTAVGRDECIRRIERFHEISAAERQGFAFNYLALTEKGHLLLRLLGLGRGD